MIEAAEGGRAEVRCADGWRLDLEVIAPSGPHAVAVCGHAMMVDRRSLDRGGAGLVSALVASGVAVVWPDLRGHGRSGPRPSEGGRWDYDDLVEQDTPALHAFARARFPGLPLFDVGHSLYGHVALAHLARHPEAPVDGLVMLAANAWLRSCEPSPPRWWKKRALMEGMRLACVPSGYFPSRRLRVGNADEAAPYVRQFLDWTRNGDWTARDGFSYRAALPSVRAPLLAVTGEGDTLFASAACVDRFVAGVPARRCVLAGEGKTLAPPGWERLALSSSPGHMALVTDGRSRPVWELVAAFIGEGHGPARA